MVDRVRYTSLIGNFGLWNLKAAKWQIVACLDSFNGSNHSTSKKFKKYNILDGSKV